MVSRYNNGYGALPNQQNSGNHHNPHGMMPAMPMVRAHRPHPGQPQSQQQLHNLAASHAAAVAAVANMPNNQNNIIKPMNHHANALVANMQQHHNLQVAQGTPPPPPSHSSQQAPQNQAPTQNPQQQQQNHSQHPNKMAQQQVVHNNANHHNTVQVPHSNYRAMHQQRTDNYHASQANVAAGFTNAVTGHHTQQIVRGGAIPQTQQSQVDGSQKNPQQQVYQQQQQRQSQQQQYQRAPTKNLNTVNTVMRPPVNSQPALNSQLINTQGAQQIYMHAGFPYQQQPGYPMVNPYQMQYGAVQTTPMYRPFGAGYNAPVYYQNMQFSSNQRGATAQMATAAPVQTMPPGTAIPQQTLMANQMAAPVAQQQQTQVPPARVKKPLAIKNPVTNEIVNVEAVSETASTTSTLDNDCSSETGRSSDNLPPEFIPGQPLSSSSVAKSSDAQHILQTETPVVSAKMDGPDITPKQNIVKNKKKIETQKHVDAENEVKSSQVTDEVTSEPAENNQETSAEYVEVVSDAATVPATTTEMSPPLPQPVPVIESALSYDAKSFEPKKQREQVQSVERSNVEQGQTIVEPTSDTNKNIITNSSLPPSKKDETDKSISTSTSTTTKSSSSEKIDETTTTTTSETTTTDNKNSLDSNIVNNNTIIKVEETSFKKEKSTTPVSVPAAVEDSDVKNVDIKTDADQINANDEAVTPVATLHASKTAPSALHSQPVHRKSEESIRLEKPLKSAASRSLEKPRPAPIDYIEGQWSPCNPDGQKKYTLEQLRVLGKTDVAKEKPNLPESLLRALIPGGKPGHAGGGGNQHRNDMRGFQGIMPGFANKSDMPTYNKRPSQQGNRQQGGKSGSRNQEPLKRISLKMHDVQLREVENAWRPKMLAGEDTRSKEEKETDELYKKFRSVMNKLTPENFDILLNEMMSTEIDTEERLKGCIKLVFEKAIAEPNYSTIYAKVCKRLSAVQINAPSSSAKKVTFRVMLLNQCQAEFEKHKDETSGQTIKNEEIEKETDEVKRKELKEQQEEEAFKIRRRAVGTVRFIGELYKIEMLNDKIMLNCVSLLLDNGDEDSLECLCKLLTTIGLRMEAKEKVLENTFKKLNEIGDKKSKVQVSSRIRFAVKDVIDLRKNNWKPRRSDTNPKTMGQIQKELDTEHRNIEILNYQTPQKDRRGGSMGKFSNKKDNDGWMTPNTKSRVQQQSFDIGKVKTNMSTGEIKLGPPTMRLGPSGGFNTMSKNPFESLSSEDTGSGPMSLSGSLSFRDNQQYNSNKYDNYSNSNNNRGGNNMHRQNSRENSRHRDGMNGPSRSFTPGGLSRQSSTSRDNNAHSHSQIMGRRSQQEPAPAADFNLNVEPPADECKKISNIMSTLIGEYLTNKNLAEFAEDFAEQIARKNRWVAVREMHYLALEKKETWREAVSKMCFHCLSSKKVSLLTTEEYKHAIKQYIEAIVDFEPDVPLIFDYTAVLLGETLNANFITLEELFKYSGSVIEACFGGKMLVALLGQLVKLYGPGRVREIWAASRLKVEQFLGDDASNVADFIAKHKLEYLADNSSQPQVSSKLTDANKIKERLQELLKTLKDPKDDHIIHEWIQANVQNTESKEFMRALTAATVGFCIEGGKLNEDLFSTRCDLLRKYIDCKGERELEVLYAVQNVCKSLEYPGGLLLQICSALSENYTISRDGFFAWRDDNTSNAMDAAGKGVCMLSLKAFFVGLCDPSDSDDSEAA
ncbi:eukaryotic translation initiation factor 4 gamma 1-like isoform X2 [Culicoides brevitarsis]|uniref:eukaryotic translation initiation factor 4 gamma 1-like isoform X2 n=1 Tax=Culicoides brevitarsis TaxID=469753 RepID=UPI00307C9E43